MTHRPTLAEVLFERDDADVGRRVLRGEVEREGCGAVCRAVVDDEELVCVGGGGEVGEGGGEHGRETCGFIVGGDDDAEVERGLVGEGGKGAGDRWGGV